LTKSARVLLVLTLLVSSGILAAAPVVSGANTTGFIRDINTAWGTPTNPLAASPGDKDLPLTVTLQYAYSEPATSVQGVLYLPSGFTLYDGTNETYSSTSGGVDVETVFQLTFQGIFLSPTLAPGAYNFSLDLWAYSGLLLLEQNSTETVYVEGSPQVLVTASTPSLAAGLVDDVPLVVANDGSGNATQLSLTVSAIGVSVLNPLHEIQSLGANDSVAVEVSVYVPTSAAGSALSLSVALSYLNPYGVLQSGSQTVGFYVSAAPPPPLVVFQAEDTSLVPGAANTIPFTVTNLGAEPIFQVHTTVSTPSQASVLTLLPTLSELGPNASATDSIEIYVSDSLANSPLELTFATSYVNAQGDTASSTQTVGLYTLGSNSSLPSVLVSVSPLSNEIGVGTQSSVTFKVQNVGQTALESPVLSLSVSSPLVVVQNSSYAVPSGILEPGESVTYAALVGAGTSASPGYYPASVTVTYLDQSGAEQSATFTSGLLLSGTIELVIQSPQVTQGDTTLSVSGEMLNEGFSSAYYANVTGSLAAARGTGESDYVGEIDPNTPVPFALTIPYTPSSSLRTADILVNVTFRDSLGLTGTHSSTIHAVLTPQSSGVSSSSSTSTSSSGLDLLTYLELGVIVALVVMAVAGFIYIRRSRTKVPSLESREREDKGVI